MTGKILAKWFESEHLYLLCSSKPGKKGGSTSGRIIHRCSGSVEGKRSLNLNMDCGLDAIIDFDN